MSPLTLRLAASVCFGSSPAPSLSPAAGRFGGRHETRCTDLLPRPRRTVGGEKAKRPEPYTGGTGARAPAWRSLYVLVAPGAVVPRRRQNAS